MNLVDNMRSFFGLEPREREYYHAPVQQEYYEEEEEPEQYVQEYVEPQPSNYDLIARKIAEYESRLTGL